MIYLLVYIALIGLIAWALVTYVPMPPPVKTVIVVVAVIACILIAFQAFGGHLPNPPVPQVR